jgi:hypothetical protein
MALLPFPPLPMIASRSLPYESRISGDVVVANSHDIIAQIFTKALSERGHRYAAVARLLQDIDAETPTALADGVPATVAFDVFCGHTRYFITESTKLLCGIRCSDVRFMDFEWTRAHFRGAIQTNSITHLKGLIEITGAAYKTEDTHLGEYPAFITCFARVATCLAKPVV